MNKEELLKAYKEKDEECDKLIEKSPMGWHDKEFEELVLLKSKLEGYEMAEEELKKKFAQEIFNQLDYDTRTWEIGEKPKSKNDIVFWMKFHNSELYEKVIMKIKRKWKVK